MISVRALSNSEKKLMLSTNFDTKDSIMTTTLIMPKGKWNKHINYGLSLVVIAAFMTPFILGTYWRIHREMTFVFQDDFAPCWEDDCVNGGIRISNWNFEFGDGSSYSAYQKGWGNGEVQCYTTQYENIHVEQNSDNKDDGVLVISSLYRDNQPKCNWTSARISSKDRRSFQWIRDKYNIFTIPINIEARIKTSMERGSWSALWMLPQPPKTNRTCLGCGLYGPWCNSGEIDIMEHVNTRDTISVGTVFNESGFCNNDAFESPRFDMTQWHVYRLEWSSEFVRWYVDGTLIRTTQLTGRAHPFNQPFYMILNLAIGGTFPGYDIALTNQSMYVDYVKAYYS
jgi:hypothetical protein